MAMSSPLELARVVSELSQTRDIRAIGDAGAEIRATFPLKVPW